MTTNPTVQPLSFDLSHGSRAVDPSTSFTVHNVNDNAAPLALSTTVNQSLSNNSSNNNNNSGGAITNNKGEDDLGLTAEELMTLKKSQLVSLLQRQIENTRRMQDQLAQQQQHRQQQQQQQPSAVAAASSITESFLGGLPPRTPTTPTFGRPAANRTQYIDISDRGDEDDELFVSSSYASPPHHHSSQDSDDSDHDSNHDDDSHVHRRSHAQQRNSSSTRPRRVATSTTASRTLKKLLIQQLVPFRGTRDPATIDHFFQRIHALLRVDSLSDPDAIELAVSLFEGRASTWWTAYTLTSQPPTRFHHFERIVRQQYNPPNADDLARDRFERCSQRGRPAHEYIDEFEELALRIQDLHTTEKYRRFKAGLDRQLLRTISIDERNLASLPQLQRAAVRIDALTDRRLGASSFNPASQQQHPSRTNNAAHQTAAVVAPPKLTPEERERLTALGACFRCRKVAGHLAADCPEFRTPARNAGTRARTPARRRPTPSAALRQVNHVEAAIDDTTHNSGSRQTAHDVIVDSLSEQGN